MNIDQQFLPSERRVVAGRLLAHLFNLIEKLFAHGVRTVEAIRLNRQLAALPDRVLLDIGIDPRSVPRGAGDMIVRPDLVQNGLIPPAWRTTSKS